MEMRAAILSLTVLLAALLAPARLRAQSQTVKLTADCADADIAEHGLVCDEDEPCPIQLELAGVEPVGSKLFIAGDFHAGPATLASLLLVSEDQGVSWTEASSRQKGVALYQVQFVDFATGWVAGHHAGALPRDPFLLRTSDGGKTWKKLPVFGDSAVGVVEQFWFDSKDLGTLIAQRRGARAAGRYLKFETRNGGDTWMLRESGEDPIEGKRPRGATSSADWRIRADNRTKTLRVEKRESGKWTGVSSFALDAGACKPAPPAPHESGSAEPSPDARPQKLPMPQR